ncbi:MAG: hypothetical protein OXC30_03065 [Alphaproteobacteria bacterium]|nr:hypothetical protein [Alphaproteobacteria bacterium]
MRDVLECLKKNLKSYESLQTSQVLALEGLKGQGGDKEAEKYQCDDPGGKGLVTRIFSLTINHNISIHLEYIKQSSKLAQAYSAKLTKLLKAEGNLPDPECKLQGDGQSKASEREDSEKLEHCVLS